MLKGALGILETYGYIGAIEGADAAVKAANVEVLGIEFVRGGLVTVEVVGEVGAVKAAVDAAVGAVTRLGISITSHVIPRPIEELWDILPKEKDQEMDEIPKEPKEDNLTEEEQEEKEEQVSPSRMTREEIEKLRVVDLRKLAREIDTSIPRGEIKYANKKELIQAIDEFYKKQGDD
ncbi:MAG: BMC domain-containing protein [Tissierellia bacterium]|nr:BMC domain-containing protein [Tissierellia bacterium]